MIWNAASVVGNNKCIIVGKKAYGSPLDRHLHIGDSWKSKGTLHVFFSKSDIEHWNIVNNSSSLFAPTNKQYQRWIIELHKNAQKSLNLKKPTKTP